MKLENKILNQFISPNNSNRKQVETLIKNVTSDLLDFLSTAKQKTPYPEFKKIDYSHSKIQYKPLSKNKQNP